MTVDTFVSTNGFTAASRAAAIGGTETRAAAAEARRVLLEMAAERLEAPVRDLTVTKGVVSVRNDPQRSVTYADLVGGSSFNRKFEQVVLQRRHRASTQELRQRDSEAARGLPHRRHARAAARTSPRRSAAPFSTCSTSVCRGCCTAASCGRADRERTASAIRPSSASTSRRSRDIPGVQIVRRRNFVGVVAEREWDAVRAARQLKVTWEPFASALPGHETLVRQLQIGQDQRLDRHRAPAM